MANWVADFLTRNPDMAALPIALRAKHSIHFKLNARESIGQFVGAPCHFLDTDGLWKPLDTKLQPASGGFYGATGLDTLIHPDGRVTMIGSTYQQYTALPGTPVGFVDGDRIIREFVGGRQYLILTETGLRQQIILDYKPTNINAAKMIASQTGTILTKYTIMPMKAVDAKRNIYYHTTLTAFRTWLASAVYPVTIDPDYAESTADGYVYGYGFTYATVQSTSFAFDNTDVVFYVGQQYYSYYYCHRSFLKFVTSSIPDTATVTQVNLKLACETDYDYSTTDFIVEIVEQDWVSQDPLAAGTQEAAYDGCLSPTAHVDWRSTSEMAADTLYTSGNLTTTYVSKTGNTYYSLRSDIDKAATEPSGDEYIALTSQEGTAAYRPILTVVYTAPAGSVIIWS